jgi:hypothetical protein
MPPSVVRGAGALALLGAPIATGVVAAKAGIQDTVRVGNRDAQGCRPRIKSGASSFPVSALPALAAPA